MDAVLRGGLHRRLELDVAVLADRLGLVQREVRVLHADLRPSAGGRWRCRCSRSRDRRTRMLGQVDRLAQHVQDPLGHELRRRVAGRRESISTTNSSPPRRPTVSFSRSAALSRAPTWRSTSSPACWPWRSLICLKPSTSMNSAVTGTSRRRARPRICSARSSARIRLGRSGQRVVQRAVLELAGPLPDQAPRSLARARQHAMQQEHEDPSRAGREPGRPRLSCRATRTRPRCRSSRAASLLRCRDGRVARGAPLRVGARAADQLQPAAGVSVVERQRQRSTARQHSSDRASRRRTWCR